MYAENVLINSTFTPAFDKKIFVGNLSIGSNLSTKDLRKAWEDAFMTIHLNSVLSVSISCKNSYIFPIVYEVLFYCLIQFVLFNTFCKFTPFILPRRKEQQ